MSTRAIEFLKQKHITFDVIAYEHEQKGAAFAAEAVGFAVSKTIKTLVVALDNREYVLALMPGDRQLSLKKTAAACGAKRAAMADTQTAERLTGYLVGGISPFGTKKRLPVIMDAALNVQDAVLINAGQRGTLLKMLPEDIIETLQARIVDLTL